MLGTQDNKLDIDLRYGLKGMDNDLADALKTLEPFEFVTDADVDEAERCGNVKHRTFFGAATLSRERAIDFVLRLAYDFNEQTAKDNEAARNKDVIERLRRVEVQAGQLAQTIANLDVYTLSALHTGGSMVPNFRGNPPQNKLYVLADGNLLPGRHREKTEDLGSSGWVIRSEALSEYADQVIDAFVRCQTRGGKDRPDRGGNTNIRRQWMASPKWQFVVGAHEIFEMCRPGEATGTEGGGFYQFVCAIFQLATGKSAEDFGALEAPVKRCAGLNRRLMKVWLRIEEIERELATYSGPLKEPPPEVSADDPRRKAWHAFLETVRLHLLNTRLKFELYMGRPPEPTQGKLPFLRLRGPLPDFP